MYFKFLFVLKGMLKSLNKYKDRKLSPSTHIDVVEVHIIKFAIFHPSLLMQKNSCASIYNILNYVN